MRASFKIFVPKATSECYATNSPTKRKSGQISTLLSTMAADDGGFPRAPVSDADYTIHLDSVMKLLGSAELTVIYFIS